MAEQSTIIRHVHVLGHPSKALDTAGAPADAQVLTCRTMCLLLARARVPFTYYGVSGSDVPAPGAFIDLGQADGPWVYGNGWHDEYTRRLQAALPEHIADAEGPTVILSLYGAAQGDVDYGVWPVIEPMVGYDHCWAPYRVFPSYAQQHVMYADQASHIQDNKWFDTVIPHFLDPDEYWIRPRGEDYALFLGRDAPDKGVGIAREVCDRAGIPLRLVHDGLHGAAKTELISGARCVLMPTVYVEPFGYVAVESQLCGVPVVATDWGAFAETVEHGQTGFRCRTMAEFLEAVRRAPVLEREPIRSRAVARYGIDAVTPVYLRYFEFVWQVHTKGGYYAPDALRLPASWGRP